MSMSNAIRLQSLSLIVQARLLLKDISFTITAGEIACLVGANGSGKSSLLRCLNRLYEPSPGSVFLGEQDITTLPVLTLRRRVGLVAQQAVLFPGTVEQNLAYGPRLNTDTFTLSDAEKLLVQVNLDPGMYLNRNVQSLSGGEAQRVSLARSLANRPEVLLLDEPTSALDPLSVRYIEQAVLTLKQQGITVVWVSHDPQQVLRVADTVIWLGNGQLKDQGHPEYLFGSRTNEVFAQETAGEGR